MKREISRTSTMTKCRAAVSVFACVLCLTGCPELLPIDVDGDGHLNVFDCDPENPTVNPSANEVCNGTDDDCDGQVDEGFPVAYADQDGDGFGSNLLHGSEEGPEVIHLCDPGGDLPDGYSLYNTDCSDDDSARNPHAEEVCDGIDNNCNGTVDEFLRVSTWPDGDSDSYGAPGVPESTCIADLDDSRALYAGDCNDNEALVHPAATEFCDGMDNDCDRVVDEMPPGDCSTIDGAAGMEICVDATLRCLEL